MLQPCPSPQNVRQARHWAASSERPGLLDYTCVPPLLLFPDIPPHFGPCQESHHFSRPESNYPVTGGFGKREIVYMTGRLHQNLGLPPQGDSDSWSQWHLFEFHTQTDRDLSKISACLLGQLLSLSCEYALPFPGYLTRAHMHYENCCCPT
jgi:hypothetical protein